MNCAVIWSQFLTSVYIKSMSVPCSWVGTDFCGGVGWVFGWLLMGSVGWGCGGTGNCWLCGAGGGKSVWCCIWDCCCWICCMFCCCWRWCCIIELLWGIMGLFWVIIGLFCGCCCLWANICPRACKIICCCKICCCIRAINNEQKGIWFYCSYSS